MPDIAGSSLRVSVEAARRESRDTRPVLLRLLVARYITAPRHSAAEQERFSELALRMFDAVNVEVAIEAATELAPHPDVPYGVILHLARGPIDVAGPVLRLSPVLDDVTLLALAETSSPQHAAAIAARREVPPALAKRLAAAMHEARGERLTRAEDNERKARPRHLAPERFLHASPMERAAILDNLVTLPPLPMSERVPRASSGMLDRLEQAALRHQPAVFASALEKAFGIRNEIAMQIVADETGEAIIVACRVLGMPFEAVSRILFFLNPSIGQSVARVFGLADLFESLPEASAHHLVVAWRAGTRRSGTTRPTEDAPSMRSFGGARRGAGLPASDAAERRRRG